MTPRESTIQGRWPRPNRTVIRHVAAKDRIEMDQAPMLISSVLCEMAA